MSGATGHHDKRFGADVIHHTFGVDMVAG
jgi:hypothetical protein